jgi:hypothetical protein
MKLRLSFILLFLLILIFGASFTQASTITVTGINGISSLDFTQGSNNHIGSYPGEFSLTSDLPMELFGYCVEQGVPIYGDTTYNILSLNNVSGFYINAAWLVDTYYYDTSFSQDYQRAALQLAIWDVLGDGLINDISSINNTDAQSYFSAIQALYAISYDPNTIAGKGYKIAKLQYQYANGSTLDVQDLIVRTVPEPATFLLFGFGLLGLGAMGKKKE